MTDARSELQRTIPALFLSSLDPTYLEALVTLLQEKEDKAEGIARQLWESDAKVQTLTLMLQRAHLALRELCRSEELLNQLPEGIRAQVFAIGDDLLIQEYAAELAKQPEEFMVETFKLGPSTPDATVGPKMSLAAAQEVQRQGGVYVSFKPTIVGHSVKGALVLRANPGWSLDRARLHSALLRHMPGAELDVTVRVEVPL